VRIGRLGVNAHRAMRRDENHSRNDKHRHDEARDREKELETSHGRLTAVTQKPPAARMEGTHSPTKNAFLAVVGEPKADR
jgi:hypothetical protein